MGAYLSKPITEKISSDETCDALSYGASSMQGWRVSQEDSHNCISDFAEKTSFFAVYDGHGGAEVAQYCSLHLPDYLKSVASYKIGDFTKALEEAFLDFDSTLKSEDVLHELKELAGHDAVEPEENEAELLNEEAFMPLEELLAKYSVKQNIQPRVSKLKRNEKVQSPMIRAKRCIKSDRDLEETNSDEIKTEINAETKADEKICKFNGDIKDDHLNIDIDTDKTDTVKNEKIHSEKENSNKSKQEPETTNLETKEVKKCSKSTHDSKDGKSSCLIESSPKNDSQIENGDESESESEASSASAEQGPSSKIQNRSRTRRQFPAVMGDNSDDDDDDDWDDEDYDAHNEKDEEEEDGKEGSEEEEEEEEDDQTIEEESEDDIPEDMVSSGKDEPGQDSGCTAVVALLHGTKLYVANAGDSRCVLSHGGQALEMSIDHKPEDITEMTRIKKAGGRVTSDGRVNGGLNLSRAIGDHFYKKNSELPPEEQMITALPDVRSITLDEDDEFMILACDGIWNFMTSQEVIDFVKERITPEKGKLSSICEELFDHCLAPNTNGDGTGCDNMTCIIIRFNIKKLLARSGDSMKRRLNTVEEVSFSKKAKLEKSSDS